MTPRPLAWRLIVRRLTRRVPPASVTTILGDLAEDYRADRQTRGWLSAEWRAWWDARSIAHAYQPARREWFDGLRFDLRLAVRGAMRRPGLTMAVVLPLAFAVAANTSLFSIVDGLLFRPLPFRDLQSLVSIRMAESATVVESVSGYVAFISGLAVSPLVTGVSIAGGTSPMFETAFSASAAADAGLRPAVVSPGFFDIVVGGHVLLEFRPEVRRQQPKEPTVDALVNRPRCHVSVFRACSGDSWRTPPGPDRAGVRLRPAPHDGPEVSVDTRGADRCCRPRIPGYIVNCC